MSYEKCLLKIVNFCENIPCESLTKFLTLLKSVFTKGDRET